MSKEFPITISSWTLGDQYKFEDRVIAAKNAGYEGIGLRAETYVDALNEGLFDKDPHKYDDAELIPVVPEITEEIKAIAGGAGSSLGTGGMATKIKAAEICKNGGIDLIIMNGRDPRHLYKVFENKPIGTLFTANGEV